MGGRESYWFLRLSDPRKREPKIDRKSTRLNSSHSQISYAVFCLKKKTNSATILRVYAARQLPPSWFPPVAITFFFDLLASAPSYFSLAIGYTSSALLFFTSLLYI